MLAHLLLALTTLVTPATAPVKGDSLVLAHEFTSNTEFTRVDLQAGQVYRLEIVGGTRVRVRTLGAGEQAPEIIPLNALPSASNGNSFEIRPSVSTVYEVRVGAVTRGTAAVRIFWDANATARRQKLIDKH